ncbi:metallo-beta-lactamase domain-containing protein [methanogenic archaeon mixed culture ISO4-G1]|nr:metallo-beta-lactamase domain-containing protein [methanogenic archaeon mixed culture ISO4-G1]
MITNLILEETPLFFILSWIVCGVIMIHFIEPALDFDSNVYLLTGDRNVLIDTGAGPASSYYIDRIREIIGPEGKLDMILLTHCHFDHIGGGPAMIDAFGCKAYAGRTDAESVREGDVRYTLSEQFGLHVPAYQTFDLSQGDVIDIGEHRLRVIDTPGHTRGGVCYYDEISSSLFSGDTLFSRGVGRTDFNGGSSELLRNSIKYLSDMQVQGLYPGHGHPTQDGMGAILRGLKMIGD